MNDFCKKKIICLHFFIYLVTTGLPMRYKCRYLFYKFIIIIKLYFLIKLFKQLHNNSSSPSKHSMSSYNPSTFRVVNRMYCRGVSRECTAYLTS